MTTDAIPYRVPRDETALQSRDFQRMADGRYVLTAFDEGIRFELARLRWSHNELIAQLTVECSLAGARTVDGRTLHVADFNVSSATARVSRAKILSAAARTNRDEVDWFWLMEELCQRTLTAETRGEPAVPLADIELPGTDDEHNIDGLTLLKTDTNMIVADGGTGKSWLALMIGGRLEQRGERVLVCDYETDGREWRKRSVAMFGTTPAGLFYRHCTAPLIHELDAIRRDNANLGITFNIVDSVAPAGHGKPEDADVATAYQRAVRQFGTGSLHLAHVPKAAQRGSERPFGSQFWWNLSRWIWVLESQREADRLTIACHHRKHNNGPQRPAVGFQFDFVPGGRVEVASCRVADVAELATILPIWQRIQQAVRQRPMTIAAIAEELDVKVDTVKKAVERKASLFTKVPGADGVSRIALVERRTA